VREAARLLRPGGTLVIADALRRNNKPLPGFMERIYRLWCHQLGGHRTGRKSRRCTPRWPARDSQISVSRTSACAWRQAPCRSHCSHTRFALRELWRARFRLSPLRRGHIVASYAAFLLGAWLPDFGYYMVTARKPADGGISQQNRSHHHDPR
jgi:SAM-dependent methyltransferase